MKRFGLFAVLLAGQLAATPAFAGIADSPLPVLEAGKKTYHLYSVPGIVRNGSYEAFFSCTSTDTVPIKVSVETFPNLGGAPANDAVADSLTVAPGATVLFGTSSTDWVVVDSDLNGFPASKSSARIIATSKKLACTAFVAKAINGGGDAEPPYPLTIIAKTKQKAAN
jgi:hypothetical protein